MFGSPETTTGGNALKFYASVRLDVRRIGAVKDREETVGNQTRVKVVKNKVSPPFRVVEFDIMYGEGVSKTGELIDLGAKAGVVEKSGSWFSYKSQRIGQGRENAKQFLRDHPEMAAEIEQTIRAEAGVGGKGIDLLDEDPNPSRLIALDAHSGRAQERSGRTWPPARQWRPATASLRRHWHSLVGRRISRRHVASSATSREPALGRA